ncbi:2'-5' RNA ligase family protein [Nocardioides sp.]|uniref:2'-5' RNA ligase family protein n=1 Tax=Nocardioides sp. TaxID=35761 RepID=UPI003D0C7DB0
MDRSALHGAAQTAVIIAVPAAEPLVAALRAQLDPAAAWGVPAHVTVLFPFVAPAEVGEPTVARLAAAVGNVSGFDCTFASCRWFGSDVLWLAPEPSQPFTELTRAVWGAFPDRPPYEGAHEDLVPHLTVAVRGGGGVQELHRAEAALTVGLPLRARVDSARLIAGSTRPLSWRTVADLPLGYPTDDGP